MLDEQELRTPLKEAAPAGRHLATQFPSHRERLRNTITLAKFEETVTTKDLRVAQDAAAGSTCTVHARGRRASATEAWRVLQW